VGMQRGRAAGPLAKIVLSYNTHLAVSLKGKRKQNIMVNRDHWATEPEPKMTEGSATFPAA